MGGMNKVLSRMSELSSLAKDITKSPSDVAVYQKEFTSLQDQLRTTIGGTTTEIGGTTGVTTPTGEFNGTQLFGSAPGVTISIGQAVGQTLTIPTANFRTGAMLSLIQQDSSGNYLVSSDDPTALDAIGDAVTQLATQRATFGGVQSRLGLTAATLQDAGRRKSLLHRFPDPRRRRRAGVDPAGQIQHSGAIGHFDASAGQPGSDGGPQTAGSLINIFWRAFRKIGGVILNAPERWMHAFKTRGGSGMNLPCRQQTFGFYSLGVRYPKLLLRLGRVRAGCPHPARHALRNLKSAG